MHPWPLDSACARNNLLSCRLFTEQTHSPKLAALITSTTTVDYFRVQTSNRKRVFLFPRELMTYCTLGGNKRRYFQSLLLLNSFGLS